MEKKQAYINKLKRQNPEHQMKVPAVQQEKGLGRKVWEYPLYTIFQAPGPSSLMSSPPQAIPPSPCSQLSGKDNHDCLDRKAQDALG